MPGPPGLSGPPGPGSYGYAPPPDAFPGRPRPGIIPLRPIALGEIFDGAFQSIRSNPRTMLGFSAVVLVVITLISLLPTVLLTTRLTELMNRVDSQDISAADVQALGATSATTAVPAALLQFVATRVLGAILVVAVSEAVLGRTIGPGALWARVKRRIWAVLWLSVLVVLLTGTLAVLAIAGGAWLGIVIGGWFGFVVLLVGVFGGLLFVVYAGVRWSLAGPALLLEDQKVTMALRRSWRLVRGSWWRVLWISILTSLIVAIGGGVVGAPFRVLAGGFLPNGLSGDTTTATVIGVLIQDIGTIVAGTIFNPFSAAVSALLYIDLRMRREGLDVELMRATGA